MSLTLTRRAMLADPVGIRLGLGAGSAAGGICTCDLSRGYVESSAPYRS